MTYIGDELDRFALAVNWRNYWSSAVRPFLGERVLEVGAGIGSVTQALGDRPSRQWLALEPDPRLADQLSALSIVKASTTIEVRCGTLEAVAEGELFDSALYIDVLEHIADDSAELAKASQRLAPGGHLIVLVPAHQFLYSEFDAAIGHFRRYGRRQLRALRPHNCEEVFVHYMDSVGLLASCGNRLVLHSGQPSERQVTFWDRRMVPISRILDPVLGYGLGKSILAVWKKNH